MENHPQIPFRARVALARELVSCARMIVANYAYEDLKNEVIKQRPNLLIDVNDYGVYFLKHSGFVIHHINKTTTHFIEAGRSNDEYKRMLLVLKDEDLHKQLNGASGLQKTTKSDNLGKFDALQLLNFLENEMDNLILLPAWYHNYLHENGIQFRNKNNCYSYMIRLVKQVIRKRNRNRVKALEFHGNTIKTAIDSIQNLATVVNNQNKTDIINGLAEVFDKIQKKILQDY